MYVFNEEFFQEDKFIQKRQIKGVTQYNCMSKQVTVVRQCACNLKVFLDGPHTKAVNSPTVCKSTH
jgi:hypothetical protein